MKRALGTLSLLAVLALAGCKEEVDTSARYVFKEETITSYLDKHEEYSEYVRLLGLIKVSPVSETSVRQLLSARGNHTCFAPTNEAIQTYLDTLAAKGVINAPDWGSFPDSSTLDSVRQVIVYNSVIDGGDDIFYETATFPQANSTSKDVEIPLSNMYDRKLTVHYCDDPDSLLVNDSPISVKNRDIPAINGVIHAMERVISPSNNTLGHLLEDHLARRKEGFHVAAMMINAAGLTDSLMQWRDETYERLYLTGMIPDAGGRQSDGTSSPAWAPEHRYYGFTLFAETDAFWEAELGKSVGDITLDDVTAYLDDKGVYPDAKRDREYTSPDNLIYQFITYHLLPERLTTNRLVNHFNEKGYNPSIGNLGACVSEFYTTMGKPRLLKIFESRESKGIFLNRFPVIDNRRHGTYRETSCAVENEGVLVGTPNMEGENNVRNGMLYPIEKLLTYDDATRDNLQKYRIRWDVAAMFPEFINNDLRMCDLTDKRHQNYYLPCDNEYRYLDGCSVRPGTMFIYWPGKGQGWWNYMGDELNIQGIQDVTMKLPPVPRRGTYEIRFAVQNGGGQRGMVQFYWGSDLEKLAVQGIPLDLRLGPNLNAKELGYEPDTDDDDYNAEVDKRMRNKGFMKGAEIHGAKPGSSSMARSNETCSRRIIVRKTMDPDEQYYIRFKTVLDDNTRMFYMDYMEYCAKEVYDNPGEPEDIW